jgi:hypothetical protein
MEQLREDVAKGFHCVWHGSGYSWTLTSLLGDLLNKAEQQYGPRDKCWTILGIEFCAGGPKDWFPGNRRHVSILLSNRALLNPTTAQFELSQEIVHLLAPNGRGPANNIEEGVATIFANQWLAPIKVVDEAYVRVEKLTQPLLAADPFSILKLRAKRSKFFDFTPDFIREYYPIISEADATALCSPFQR